MARTKRASFTPWLTATQVARTLRVNSDKIRSWIRSGELVAVDVSQSPGGRPRWRITPDALDKFAERRAAVVAPRSVRHRRGRDDVTEFF